MKTMVNAFAEYAKPSTIQFQKLNVGNLIEEVVGLYPPQSGLEFRVELDRKLPLVSADPIKLRQVFHNLFKNSQEAMPAGEAGRISISSGLIQESHHDFVEIRLSDNGPGIPADQVDRVFEPYVTTKARGTGLGLAIVKKIVEEHGGNIRLMSGNQEGITVVIRLPIVSISKQQAVEV
jgi:nitrogen fixation/metabolism regulation signal transduction histidine kinase